MKYIGFVMILSSVLFFSDGYSKYMKKRVLEGEGFLAFLSYASRQMSCYLRPQRSLADGFECEALSEVGFLDAVRESESIFAAYKKTKSRLSIGKEERELLEEFFASFGEGYLEDEIKRLDFYSEGLRKAVEKAKTDAPKNTRLVSVLSVTAALGFLIFVI